MPDLEEVDSQVVARASNLIGLGARSGAVVVGLSAVRRTGDLALVFLAASVSANTQEELSRLQRAGVRVVRCPSLEPLTAAMGRQDASVVGVRTGSMAAGIIARLEPEPGAAG